MTPNDMNEADAALQKKFDLWMKEAYKHRILNEIRAREREWQKQQRIMQRLAEQARENDGLMDMDELNDIGIGDMSANFLELDPDDKNNGDNPFSSFSDLKDAIVSLKRSLSNIFLAINCRKWVQYLMIIQ